MKKATLKSLRSPWSLELSDVIITYLTSRISVSSSKTRNCHRTRNWSYHCCYYCFHWPVLNKSADLQWPPSIPRISVGCVPDGVRLRSSRSYIIKTLSLVTLFQTATQGHDVIMALVLLQRCNSMVCVFVVTRLVQFEKRKRGGGDGC
jgi:hypothetical protein